MGALVKCDLSPIAGSSERRNSMKTVSVFIDGACSGNPGPGGWGAILRYGNFTKEISGSEANTTIGWSLRQPSCLFS